VGTGFHPELSGRENVFLNGAILGMGKREIRKRFDEIVAFAGVDKFIDTPIKRYSSGMSVRLAFAVAAHLEPDIVVVDEVLAVGDAEFQKKCLGKMHDVASKEGRTVLLVSHNLAAISEMAGRALLLDSGRVATDGTVSEAISTYLSKGALTPIYVRSPEKRCSTPHVTKMEVFTSDSNGVHLFGKPLEVKVWIRHDKTISRGCFSFQIINQYQQPVIHAFIYHPNLVFSGPRGESILTCQFPSLRLNVGQFYLRAHLSEPPGGDLYETIDGVCPFNVVRPNEQVLWGWRPEVCAYHEQCTWSAIAAQSLDEALVD
jgi:energy-coupling factor transporter ATP-binding protein EcfA2